MSVSQSRYRVVTGLIVLALAAWAGTALVRGTGSWLTDEDPVARAGAVAVFGGVQPLRSIDAADLYERGMAAQVWLTTSTLDATGRELAKLEIAMVPEHEYSLQVLEKCGVPRSSVRVLSQEVQNTAEEVVAIADEAKAAGLDKIILMTSPYHTRRVRILWDKLVGEHPQAIVSASRSEPFDGDHWWRKTDDARYVARECFGILNAWLDFPLTTDRRGLLTTENTEKN